MLRTLGWFLSVFWLVGLLVHLSGMIHLLGIAAVALFLIDLVAPDGWTSSDESAAGTPSLNHLSGRRPAPA